MEEEDVLEQEENSGWKGGQEFRKPGGRRGEKLGRVIVMDWAWRRRRLPSEIQPGAEITAC